MTASRPGEIDVQAEPLTREGDAPREPPVRVALIVCGLAYLPFAFLGYGTDIDVANLLRSGSRFVDHGDYEMSRGPGAPVHELATGLLDAIGGSVLVNLVTILFGLLALWALEHLVRADGGRWSVGAMLVLASQPWFWIATTSLGDFSWAIGLLLTGFVLHERGHPWAGAVLVGLAIGCRSSTVLCLAAWVIAKYHGGDRASLRETLRFAGAAAVVGLLCFVPPWLAADMTLGFVRNQFEFVGFGVHVGRWFTKNVALIGILPGLVLLVGARSLASGLRRFGSSWLVRYAVLQTVLAEVLFFRLPFKVVHLLPVVVALAIVVGMATEVRRRWIVALVVAQLLSGLVGTTIAAPDIESNARGGSIRLGVTEGPLLTDVRCRLDDLDRGAWDDPASPAATDRASVNFECQSGSWRGEP